MFDSRSVSHGKRWISGIVLFAVFSGFHVVYSQGFPRSTGIGVRGGAWALKESRTTTANLGEVTTTGAGGDLFLFSRFKDNWYLEASIGSVVDSRIGWGVETNLVIPLLFGLRYDLLSTRHASSFQPYLHAGGGIFSILHSNIGVGVTTENDFRLGWYAGGGVNIALLGWLGMNCDITQNIVDMSSTPLENYSGLRFGFGFYLMWGKRREIFQVEGVNVIVNDIYPAYYRFYNTYPVAIVTVVNKVSYPIEINVKSQIQDYTERVQESGYHQLEPGETKNIPVYALFGTKLLQSSRREPAIIDLELEGRAGGTFTRTVSANLTIHNKNAWNGEIDKLGFFITPDHEKVLSISRTIPEQLSENADERLRQFSVARLMFNELLAMNIRYHADPNIPFYRDDRVQFASETVVLKTGDCDDLVVLYSSLLESVGIQTAFVDVQDPEKNIAHVYLMFDTGLTPEQSGLISSNDKRFVVRENRHGGRSVWVPVETTLLDRGFDSAWRQGALQYLKEGILRNGSASGWVKIIDME